METIILNLVIVEYYLSIPHQVIKLHFTHRRPILNRYWEHLLGQL
jgi:hypothetical protein